MPEYERRNRHFCLPGVVEIEIISLLTVLLLPGSSAVEQVTVNHLVGGSIPPRAAISESMAYEYKCLFLRRLWKFFEFYDWIIADIRTITIQAQNQTR